MEQIIRIGVDTSKHVFQLHGVDASERPVLRKTLRRRQVASFFGSLAPTLVGLEACGGSHHWARLLRDLGHEVRLLPPQFVKPYVKRGKNDAADAAAICEAMSRPDMRFVPVKTVDAQAALMLTGVRERLIRQRTQLANAIRGHAAEFGLVAAKGLSKIGLLLARIAADETLPVLARDLFAVLGEDYARLQAQLKDVEARLMAWHRQDECSRRLAAIPGIGPVGAAMLTMKAPDPHAFKSGRQFAAWIGLTPKDHSTAGRTRLGGITRAGDEALRSVLVAGATAVIQQARRGRGQARQGQARQAKPSPTCQTAYAQTPYAQTEDRRWLLDLLKRKEPKEAAVALANKTARIAWKLMVSGQTYTPRGAA
ncbi:MAG: IS110 family transposase [Holophagales bacterium]|nr:IS110 family transposase [Holophagales bacterium]